MIEAGEGLGEAYCETLRCCLSAGACRRGNRTEIVSNLIFLNDTRKSRWNKIKHIIVGLGWEWDEVELLHITEIGKLSRAWGRICFVSASAVIIIDLLSSKHFFSHLPSNEKLNGKAKDNDGISILLIRPWNLWPVPSTARLSSWWKIRSDDASLPADKRCQ